MTFLKNKKGTASTQYIIKNKMKTPHPASSFSNRPAKLQINFTWPKLFSLREADLKLVARLLDLSEIAEYTWKSLLIP